MQRGASSPALEQKEKSKGEEQLASYARDYVAKVENDLQKIREGVLALTDKKLIPLPSTDESNTFYYKMKSDYCRYLAECATDDAKGKATEGICAAYAKATEIAGKDLVVTHPVHLAMALSSVVAQRQIPFDQTVQKTVEAPQLQCIDKVVDDPIVQVQCVEVLEKTAETPQTQTIQGTQAPESLAITPVCQVRQTGHVEELVEVSKVFSQDTAQQRFGKQIIEIPAETQMIQSARTSERSGTAPVCQMTQAEIGEVIEIGASIPAESASPIFVTAPVLDNSPVVVESEQPVHVAEYMALAPMVSEIRDLESDLVHIRELLGILVRKERSAEANAEIAARRLNKTEQERDQESEAECEATVEEALANHSKVVKVIVDKWFVDKGFGFGKTPTGQVVFIHASAVQGAEVLKIGTDARVEVVKDDARAQGGYRARRAWGQDAWKAEKDKERANKVAQQVRRAAALTAELAAQSEKKTAVVCDQPPGLDELAGHIEAPNMGGRWLTPPGGNDATSMGHIQVSFRE